MNHALPKIIAPSAIEAAIDFVKVCCQHPAYITGCGTIDHELEILEAGTSFSSLNLSKFTMV